MEQNEIIDKDEVLKMARQAGLIVNSPYLMPHDHVMRGIEAFAKLVEARTEERTAAKEREQIIAITETQEFSRMHGEFTPSAYDLVKAIRARGEA